MFRSKKKKSRSSATDFSPGLFAWVGNLAIFYVILLTLVTIPLVILFVILSVRAAMDYHIWILTGIFLLLTGLVFLVVQRRRQIRKRFEKEKKDVMEVISTAAREGHNVNVSFLHGLIRLDYQTGNNDRRLLIAPTLDQIKSLPLETNPDGAAEVVVIDSQTASRVRPLSIGSELEKLSGLLDRGVLTETEFRELKKRLLNDKEL